MAKMIDPRPRHQQIAAELRAQILSGELPAGSKFPTIQQLMVRFGGVANQTIQNALKALRAEGFIVSGRGVGVHVRDRQPHVVDVANYFAPSPGGYSYDDPEVSEVRPPAEVREALGLPEDGVAVLRHRMTRYAGEPVELCWSYYPVEIARGTKLARAVKIKDGAPRVLAELGYPQREMVDEVFVRMPTTEELETLELPNDVPVVCQFRVIYSDDQRPVEVSTLVRGGHLYKLRYRQPIH